MKAYYLRPDLLNKWMHERANEGTNLRLMNVIDPS